MKIANVKIQFRLQAESTNLTVLFRNTNFAQKFKLELLSLYTYFPKPHD